MASMSDEPPIDDEYDIAPAPIQPVPAAVRVPTPPAAQQAVPAAIGYRAKKDDQSTITSDTDRIRNFQMPIWLLGGGIVIEAGAMLFHGGPTTAALTHIGVDLLLSTGVMLAGILIAAWVRQIQLGNFWTAAFKLSAISIAPTAAVDLVSPLLAVIPFGWVPGLLLQFVLYFALLGALFDLDESDTWYCVWVIFLVRLVVYFVFLWMRP
jgi:hypothetical protein